MKRIVSRAVSAPSVTLFAVNRQSAVATFQRRFFGNDSEGGIARTYNVGGPGGRPQQGFQQQGFDGQQRAQGTNTRNRLAPTPKETIYVGNLFFEVKAEDLKNLFSKYGNVLEARLITDSRGMSRG